MSKVHVQAALLMIVLFVFGAISGIAIDRMWLGPNGPHHGPPLGPMDRGPPDPERVVAALRADLALTEAQVTVARAAFAEANEALEALRATSEPRARAAIEGAREKLLAVLTPEQAEKFRNRMPRPDGRLMPPGPPPGGLEPRDGLEPQDGRPPPDGPTPR